jgi:hypothetical protein
VRPAGVTQKGEIFIVNREEHIHAPEMEKGITDEMNTQVVVM